MRQNNTKLREIKESFLVNLCRKFLGKPQKDLLNAYNEKIKYIDKHKLGFYLGLDNVLFDSKEALIKQNTIEKHYRYRTYPKKQDPLFYIENGLIKEFEFPKETAKKTITKEQFEHNEIVFKNLLNKEGIIWKMRAPLCNNNSPMEPRFIGNLYCYYKDINDYKLTPIYDYPRCTNDLYEAIDNRYSNIMLDSSFRSFKIHKSAKEYKADLKKLKEEYEKAADIVTSGYTRIDGTVIPERRIYKADIQKKIAEEIKKLKEPVTYTISPVIRK